MKKTLILLILSTSIGGFAQEKNAKGEEPGGKTMLEVFGNFHTGFGSEKEDRGFALERCYMGYEYNIGNGLTIKGVMDVGKSADVDDYQRIAYLKNAMVSWKKGGLTLNGGLIPTTQFRFQERFWGGRYIRKSFQDEYKFGSSADLGVSAAYRFAGWISADAIVVNGEGYKRIQMGDGLNYGLGVTLTPFKGLQVRLYGGLNEGGEEGKEDIANVAAFVGYRHERFSMGAEYNYMRNTAHSEGANQWGYSVYASVKVARFAGVYARFDDLCSNDGWNRAKDEAAAIVGAQFKLGKYVKIAPNFRVSMPKADGAKNGYYAYVSCYFGF